MSNCPSLENRVEKLEERTNELSVEIGVLGERMTNAVDKLSVVVDKLNGVVDKIADLDHFKQTQNSKLLFWRNVMIGLLIAVGSASITKVLMMVWK